MEKTGSIVSNHSRDYDKVVALLKSVAAPCQPSVGGEHLWRECRHCLAIAELEHASIRRALGAFLDTVAVMDKDYGK